MKRKNSSIKYQTSFKTVVKPLVICTALGMMSQAHAINSPFSTIPLHLQNVTRISGQGVPPNVLVQFDDSGSMSWVPEADCEPNSTCSAIRGRKASSKSRMEVAREALLKILDKKEYTTDVNWGLITLHGNEKPKGLGWSTREYAENFVAGRREFALDIERELKPLVRHLHASSHTPAAERYLDAIHMLRFALNKNDAYRCQKSYVIVFSDGDADGFLNVPKIEGTKFTPSTKGLFYYNGRPSYSPNFETWVAHKTPFTYSLENASRFTKPPLYNWPGWVASLLSKEGNQYKFNITNKNGNPNRREGETDAKGNLVLNFWDKSIKYKTETLPESWGGHPDAMPLFANMAYYTDLKTDGTDAANQSWDDAKNGFDKQRIETFAIGFGAGLSKVGLYALDNMSTANQLKALNASNEAELNAAFERIFSTIKASNKVTPPASIATISPALSSNDTVTQVPTAAATIHLDLASGSSEIRFYKVNKQGNDYAVTDTNYTTPDFSQRQILINEGGTTNRVYWLKDFQKDNDFFNLNNPQNSNEWKMALLPWIARSKPDAEIASMGNNSVSYRIRQVGSPNKRDLGDVIGASLYPTGEHQYGREKYLITAANDGMVYLFESMNSVNHPYGLKLNYIPAGMQRETPNDTVAKHFKYIADKEYLTTESKPHQYLLNGDFTVRTTEKNYPKRIFMSGNMGQGGRGSYSLNIGGSRTDDVNAKVGLSAPSSTWKESVPLFETPKNANRMGYTIGAPQIGRLSENRSINFGSEVTQQTDLHNVYYATFINSGVRHPDDLEHTESALYVYASLDRENVGLRGNQHKTSTRKSGDFIQKIVADERGGGLAQATLVDNDFDGVIDIAYAGDYKGGLYRFDLRKNPNEWKASKIFQTEKNQPITSAPAVYRNDKNDYIVIFGTGSDLYQSDLDSTAVQAVYGIFDDLTQANPSQVRKTDLLQQALGHASSVPGYVTRDLTDFPLASHHKGWYYNLDLEANSGERVVVKPTMLLKTVLLNTRQYYKDSKGKLGEDLCLASSSTSSTKSASWIMQFRADTGGKLPMKSTNGEDVDLFAYVDFARANTERQSKNRYTNSLFAGYQVTDSGIVSTAKLFGDLNSSMAGGRGSAYTNDGDAGSNGEDIPITTGPVVPRKCIPRGVQNIMMLSKSTDVLGSGVSESLNIYAKECQTASIRRISWREIF